MLTPAFICAHKFGIVSLNTKAVVDWCIVIIASLLLFGDPAVSRMISNLIVIPYALWRTSRHLFCTSTSPDNVDHVKTWLLFWAIYAEVQLLVSLLLLPNIKYPSFQDFSHMLFKEPLLSYIPLYWMLKTLSLFVICMPPFHLCGVWYKKWVKPAEGENGLKYVKSLSKFLLYVPAPVSLLAIASTLLAPVNVDESEMLIVT